MSCGKKAEPVQEVTPVPEAIVEQEVTPEATPVVVTPEPSKKVTTPKEAKTVITPETQKTATPATVAKPKELTLEEKLKIFDQLTPAEQKEVLKQVEEKKNAAVGTGTKTSKKKN